MSKCFMPLTPMWHRAPSVSRHRAAVCLSLSPATERTAHRKVEIEVPLLLRPASNAVSRCTD